MGFSSRCLSLSDLVLSLFLSALDPPNNNSNSSADHNNNTNNAHRVTDLDRAVLQLKTQRRQLEGAAARTARLVERERAAALAAVVASSSGENNNRQAALAALRRKKLHEARLAAVDSYLLNVEEALAGIDDARATASVASALRAGADALKALRASAPLAEVEAILADSRAAAEYEASMARLLENAGTGLDAAQEASAERELEALVASEEEKEAREEAGRLPEAPRHEATEEKKKEEGEEEEALPSAPTGVVSVVGGREREGVEAEIEGEERRREGGGTAKEKERVPVLAA